TRLAKLKTGFVHLPDEPAARQFLRFPLVRQGVRHIKIPDVSIVILNWKAVRVVARVCRTVTFAPQLTCSRTGPIFIYAGDNRENPHPYTGRNEYQDRAFQVACAD